jgi:hypothetical protein
MAMHPQMWALRRKQIYRLRLLLNDSLALELGLRPEE